MCHSLSQGYYHSLRHGTYRRWVTRWFWQRNRRLGKLFVFVFSLIIRRRRIHIDINLPPVSKHSPTHCKIFEFYVFKITPAFTSYFLLARLIFHLLYVISLSETSITGYATNLLSFLFISFSFQSPCFEMSKRCVNQSRLVRCPWRSLLRSQSHCLRRFSFRGK